jgi:hypothetical protein
MGWTASAAANNHEIVLERPIEEYISGIVAIT